MLCSLPPVGVSFGGSVTADVVPTSGGTATQVSCSPNHARIRPDLCLVVHVRNYLGCVCMLPYSLLTQRATLHFWHSLSMRPCVTPPQQFEIDCVLPLGSLPGPRWAPTVQRVGAAYTSSYVLNAMLGDLALAISALAGPPAVKLLAMPAAQCASGVLICGATGHSLALTALAVVMHA